MLGEAATLFAGDGTDIHHVTRKMPVGFLDLGPSVQRHEGDRDLQSAQQRVPVERVDTVIAAQHGQTVSIDHVACRRWHREPP